MPFEDQYLELKKHSTYLPNMDNISAKAIDAFHFSVNSLSE
jgi:hypothetical protein